MNTRMFVSLSLSSFLLMGVLTGCGESSAPEPVPTSAITQPAVNGSVEVAGHLGEVVITDHGVLVGSADAPEKLSIVIDVQCPYCADLKHQTNEEVRQRISDGQMSVEYILLSKLNDHSPAHYSARGANLLAVIAHSTSAEHFFDAMSVVYENQPAKGSDPADVITDQGLVDALSEVGVNLTEDELSQVSGMGYESWVEGNNEYALPLIDWVPWVIVNGEAYPALTDPVRFNEYLDGKDLSLISSEWEAEQDASDS